MPDGTSECEFFTWYWESWFSAGAHEKSYIRFAFDFDAVLSFHSLPRYSRVLSSRAVVTMVAHFPPMVTDVSVVVAVKNR